MIDDDPSMRDLFREVLSDEGYELLFVQSLEHVEADAVPDLVIADLVGIRPYAGDLARALIGRVQKRFPSKPIIVCTGYQQATKESDRLGAATVLRKPFAIEELVKAVARVAAG